MVLRTPADRRIGTVARAIDLDPTGRVAAGPLDLMSSLFGLSFKKPNRRDTGWPTGTRAGGNPAFVTWFLSHVSQKSQVACG